MHYHLLLSLSLLLACGTRDLEEELIDQDLATQDASAGGELTRGADPTQLKAARRASARYTRALVEDLASPTRYQQAIDALVAMGEDALPALEDAAARGGELAVRGRAILAIGRIPGERADALLLSIQDDSKDEPLARTWAAAARIRRAGTLDEVLGFAPLLSTMPALERPLKLQVEATAGDLQDVSGLLRLIELDDSLGAVLSDAVLAAGADPLLDALLTGESTRVRQLAAGFLATLIQQDPAVADAVADAYRFVPQADAVPWAGGPLYIPSASWSREQAQTIVGALITWYLFAEARGDREAQDQIYNNLISVNLSRVAGLRAVANSSAQLLHRWARVVGDDGIAAILSALGADLDPRYSALLKELK